MTKQKSIQSRTVTHADLPQLLELEKEWPEHARATEKQLSARIKKFSEGYFVAVDKTEIVASIISHPYDYFPHNLSNFQSWSSVLNKCYLTDVDFQNTNALYIISGTVKKAYAKQGFFNDGIVEIVNLAKKIGKKHVVAGSILPGYARHLNKIGHMSAADYVFESINGRFLDPMIEKYRRLDFKVPDKSHVMSNYFPDESSLNYSALVVKDVNP